uniref:Uncharacterized protein n=1 Tax=Anguilla anguilla TaxID=7936 RepID=A0A0E9V7R1_ANGAN
MMSLAYCVGLLWRFPFAGRKWCYSCPQI